MNSRIRLRKYLCLLLRYECSSPLWLTNGVYRISTAPEVVRQGGILHPYNQRRILRPESPENCSYPGCRHKYILSLMREFKLCYDLDRGRVLIPQLLPVMEPDFVFDEEGSLRFVLHYPDFLPKSVLPRFMVRLHNDIKDDLRWRTGLVLENEDFGTTALIRADNEARRISIFVNGTLRKDYLAVILLFFREIKKSFEELKVSELVPIPDNSEVTARYTTLLKHAEKGMLDYLPDDSDKVYSVKELLDLVRPGKDNKVEEMLRMILERLDERESGTEVLSSLFELKPSILGVSLNLKGLFEELLLYEKRKGR
ncbi:MAG: hypothetical protein D3924_08685 [Candidatus Electrothrix sp. AR4]|nr:hypothetical protein [Candidatus Electrothrix sp. AR4]